MRLATEPILMMLAPSPRCLTAACVVLCLEPATVESGNQGVNNSLFGVTYCKDPGGTFEKSEPSPSAMVGWTRTASRSLPYGRFARIAVVFRSGRAGG